ncbi:hypothetical protein JG688_00013321, partial [Phytophthora aleatoria]
MPRLYVILSFAAAALALTTFDGVNAASLRTADTSERFLTSFDSSTSGSTDGERFLFEVEGSESSDADSSESFDGDRFLVEMEGSDSAADDEGSESFAGVRFLAELFELIELDKSK